MFRDADRIQRKHVEQEFDYGTYIYDANPDGLTTQPIEILLTARTLYRGGQQERANALDAHKEGAICFLLALHDIGHVAGRWVSAHNDFEDAVKEAERLSKERADVTIHACALGWGFPECDLGVWSSGRLVTQFYFKAKGVEAGSL
jgi:hypothetical protein